MKTLPWITDRLPNREDADKNEMVLVEIKDGIHDTWYYSALSFGNFRAWAPLSGLPLVKLQEEKDKEEYRREMIRCNNAINGETFLPWRLACAYARADLRKQLREHINKCPLNIEHHKWWNGLIALTLDAEEGK